MTSDVAQAIATFESLGGEFTIDGSQILVEYSPERREAVATILEMLRTHRDEVAIVVRERSSGVPAPVGCPPLPLGVRLIKYAPKTPPVAVRPCSIVADVDKFISAYLRDLRFRLEHPKAYACAQLPDILAKLAEVGLELRLEAPSDAK